MILKYAQRLICILLFTNCTVNYGQLNLVGHLQGDLEEVSGLEIMLSSDQFLMINDGGNDSDVYVVNTEGKIERKLEIDVENEDWEDLTTDNEGNLYVGDFGNNRNKRKDLKIYKLPSNSLKNNGITSPIVIEFSFPKQKKFPPKKKNRHFDVESFFYQNGYLYLFTKSRTNKDYGRTDLYKIPATAGKHEAQYINTFNTCDDLHCWITSADISPDGTKVVLLSHHTVWQFTDFSGDDFFSGKMTKFNLDHTSQKEGICFKDNNTVYITDEESHGKGRNLYVFTLD